MFWTVRRTSLLFDISIVLIDLIIGFVGAGWFEDLLGNNENPFSGIWVSFFVLITGALYVWALIKFSAHFKSNIFLKAGYGDYIAMLFNAVIAGAMIPLCFQAFWPGMPMGVFIALIFIVMIGWFTIHIRTFNLAEQPKTSEISDYKYKTKILLMMLPFSAAALAPTNALAGMIRLSIAEDPKGILLLIFYLMLGAFCTAFLAWATAYLPRRMSKAALEIPSSGKWFFWMLFAEYFLKMLPF